MSEISTIKYLVIISALILTRYYVFVSLFQVSPHAPWDLRLLAKAAVSPSVQTRRTLHPRYVLKNCDQKSPKESERRLRERFESAKRNENSYNTSMSNESEKGRVSERERESVRERVWERKKKREKMGDKERDEKIERTE